MRTLLLGLVAAAVLAVAPVSARTVVIKHGGHHGWHHHDHHHVMVIKHRH
jgi:Spy/CpxP family protein refolding chaperone